MYWNAFLYLDLYNTYEMKRPNSKKEKKYENDID